AGEPAQRFKRLLKLVAWVIQVAAQGDVTQADSGVMISWHEASSCGVIVYGCASCRRSAVRQPLTCVPLHRLPGSGSTIRQGSDDLLRPAPVATGSHKPPGIADG